MSATRKGGQSGGGTASWKKAAPQKAPALHLQMRPAPSKKQGAAKKLSPLPLPPNARGRYCRGTANIDQVEWISD
eukprot:9482731-Pyramimonas_sp.AAC.1